MLKDQIRKGELTVRSWITLGNTGIAEILANAGFDWLVIDLEHTTISLEQAGELIRTIGVDVPEELAAVEVMLNGDDILERYILS